MKLAEDIIVTEWRSRPADEHTLRIADVLKIQADALRHAESIARSINRRVKMKGAWRICRALEQEAIKVQNEFIARSDSQAK